MTETSTPPIRPRVSILRVLLTAIVATLGIAATVLVVLAVSPSARVQTVRTTLQVMGADLPRDALGHTNILLLGTGDANHDGADLTDTMIIVSIDPAGTRSIVMVSLPRDLFLDANRQLANGRINALYANEKYRLMAREGLPEDEASLQALAVVAEELGAKTGVEIHGVVKADFTAFVNVVDMLGGVDIDVPKQIVDYTYPITETSVGLFRIDEGMQHLDGETALRYARSRHSTTDFDRSARQQQLIRALAEKAKALGRLEQIRLLFSLDEQLEGHVETTMTDEQLLGLAQIAADLSLDRVVTAQLNYTTGGDTYEAAAGGFVYPAPPEMFEGASILLPMPVAGKTHDWSQIRTFIQFLKRERALYLRDPSVFIEDLGARAYEAHRLRNELLRYAWRVEPVEYPRPDEPPAQSTVYYRDPEDQDAAAFLAALLELPVARTETAGTGSILIQLGSSFTYRPFETLSGAVLPRQNVGR